MIYKHGRLPYTMTARTGGGGTHEFFVWPADLDLPYLIGLADGLEVIGEGHVVVATPSLHPSGRRYQWEPELGPDEMAPQPAPGWLLDAIRPLVVESSPPSPRGTFPAAQIDPILAGCAWLAHCRTDAVNLSEPEWYGMLSIVGRCRNGDQLAHEFSKPYLHYSSEETAAKLQHALRDAGPATCARIRNSLGGSSFCNSCSNAGRVKSPIVLGIRRSIAMSSRVTADENHPIGERPTTMEDECQPLKEAPDLINFLHNDHGNGERLLAMSGEDLGYCHAFKKWLVWDGMRWAVDDTDQARHLAKRAMLEFLRQAVGRGAGDTVERFARGSLDARRITSLLSMAECESFVRPSGLDTNPNLLNFLNGTVDLSTGTLRSHERRDFITKLIHYHYKPAASCHRWLAFLNQIMGGGPDAGETDQPRAKQFVDYLQRAFGYSLTGCTIEKAVFVLFGAGDNGKSTMLNTFRQLVEEYAVLLQADTLMVRQESNNTQADLADLRGARFVQTSETEEGQRLAQGKLKRITQGMGKIKAVRKYENPIEFPETHKLWMDTNRKPTIRDADDQATFSRLHPIPFTVKITKIDRDMPAKLLQEAEGILAWAVAGAKLWHESGLHRPAEVDAARDEWRSEADQLGRFIGDCCVTTENSRVPASALYAEYKRWAEGCGEKDIMSATAFGSKLPLRGFAKQSTNRGIVYLGIGLKAAAGEGGEGS
jgi:putative DNA primase/helicase